MRVTHNSLQLINPWPLNSRSNWNLELLVFEEGGKPENLEKSPRSKGENQQQTQPTYDAGSENRTRDTLVGGERSHHCATPAPPPAVVVVDSVITCKRIYLWRQLGRPVKDAGFEIWRSLSQILHPKCYLDLFSVASEYNLSTASN